MDDTLEAMKAVSEDGDIVPEKVLEALEDDSHPLAKPNDSESDPKSLQEMIQSMETADESQGSQTHRSTSAPTPRSRSRR